MSVRTPVECSVPLRKVEINQLSRRMVPTQQGSERLDLGSRSILLSSSPPLTPLLPPFMSPFSNPLSSRNSNSKYLMQNYCTSIGVFYGLHSSFFVLPHLDSFLLLFLSVFLLFSPLLFVSPLFLLPLLLLPLLLYPLSSRTFEEEHFLQHVVLSHDSLNV